MSVSGILMCRFLSALPGSGCFRRGRMELPARKVGSAEKKILPGSACGKILMVEATRNHKWAAKSMFDTQNIVYNRKDRWKQEEELK